MDTWEILPGDSLVQKIFEEGIGDAEAIIVVLSEHSINKPWVREELDVSTVRKIEEGVRLIPVLIGNVRRHQVPMSLRATVWERIDDLNNYEAELSRIVDAVYGHRTKPPLGQQPEYIRSEFGKIPGLSSSDSIVLRMCCEMEQQAGDRFTPIESVDVIQQAEQVGLHREQVAESMEILDGRGYIKAAYTNDIVPLCLTVTDRGFDEYGRIYTPDYDVVVRSIGLEIVNNAERDSVAIAETLDIPLVMVEHILGLFESQRYIDLFHETGPGLDISRVSAELRRWLEGTQ